MSGLRSIKAEVLTLRQRSTGIAEFIGIGVDFRKFKRNREEGKAFFQSAGPATTELQTANAGKSRSF